MFWDSRSNKGEDSMKEYAYTVNLKDDPEVIRQYDAYHAAIWPEVAASLKAVGMREVSIWRLGRRLFMVVRADDDFDPVEAGRRHRATHPRILEWETLMDSYQERVPEYDGPGFWAQMPKVFEL